MFATWIYNGAMLSLALLSAPRWRHRPTAAAALLAAGLALIPAACSLEGFDVFGFLRLFGWSCFGWLPAVLVIACGPSPVLRRAAAGALLAIAGWAYGVEPHWLEVTRHEIVGAVERPTRLVLLADLQTDSVGAWEQGVLRRAFQELQPDLVLLAGDYVQRERGGFTAEAQRLQAVLREVAGGVPAFAVQGDVDDPGWEVQFEGTGIAASARSRTVAVAGLSLTVLGLQDSRSVSPPVPAVPGFHVVLGHAPDFALAAPPADLLLAGHTHGGQVRLPGIGPLATLSRVPRSWAAGRTELERGTLIVSRGIGVERDYAPRLRLFCRPELVVIDVLPGAVRPRRRSGPGRSPARTRRRPPPRAARRSASPRAGCRAGGG